MSKDVATIITVASAGISKPNSFMNLLDLKLSVLQPIHATWLVEMSQHNFFASALGRVHVLKGKEKAGMKECINWKGSITASVFLHCQ